MATVMPNDKCMNESSPLIQHSQRLLESQSFLNSSKENYLHQTRRSESNIDVNEENILLEEAICNVVISLSEDNDIYINDEEKELKRSSLGYCATCHARVHQNI
jgi:hypothetical protein